MNACRPDQTRLFEFATEQSGYFTAAQARASGFTSSLLNHHVQSGRFVRIRRGLYRFRDYPSSPREDVMVAWLAVGKDVAVVSHESALDLHDLSDVIPGAVHLTVPRAKRHLPVLHGVTIHTTTRRFRARDIVTRSGFRVTAAARTIVDAAESGNAPEQIELAVSQALERGLTTPQELREVTHERSRRVTNLVLGAASEVGSCDT